MDEEVGLNSSNPDAKEQNDEKYCSYRDLRNYRQADRFRLTPWLLGILALSGWVTVFVFAFLWDRSVHAPKAVPLLEISESWLAEFPNAAAATDNGVCSEIARDILRDGGNAVDAAIAALVCDGNQNPFSMGIGGGFFMVIYNSTTGKCTSVDARESAPLWTGQNLSEDIPRKGWNSIATPGEIMGYWEVYKKFGSKPWKDLWAPSIKLARDGLYVSSPMAKMLNHQYVHKYLMEEPTMSFYINPKTGDVYKAGEKLKNPIFAQTLDKISNSEDPVDLFYRGDLGNHIIEEIQKFGGNLSMDDLGSYKIVMQDGWETHLPNLNLTFCSLGLPSGGPAVGLLLQILDALNVQPKDMTKDLETATLAYHRLIEASKFAYGHWKYFADSNDTELLEAVEKMKTTKYAKSLADKIGMHPLDDISHYDPEIGNSGETGPLDKGGTAQISLIDQWGNSVSVTSSLNWFFGSMRRSPTTGIVWNNHLADFSSDKNSQNSARSGKRPRSAMTPAIIYQKSDRMPKLVIGGAGGSKILGAVGYVSGRALYLNETLKYASDAPRFFNRAENKDATKVESNEPEEILFRLQKLGHKFTKTNMPSIIQAVQRKNKNIFAHSDHRKRSYPAGY